MNTLRNCTRLLINSYALPCTNYTARRHIARYVRPTLVELTKRKQKYAHIQPQEIRSNFLEWNRNSELYAFNVRLYERFDPKLLEQALRHKCYVAQEEAKQKELGIENSELDLKDNTELILEGKTIVPQILQNYLGQALPYAPKECIIALQNYLMSVEVLSNVCSSIGAKDLILCSTHPVPEKILADSFLALVSALIRSTDMPHASAFARDFLISILAEKDLAEIWCPEEPFKVLNDILFREEREFAEPRLMAQSGQNTLLAVYQVALYSNKKFLGIGVGNTVEEAQKIAALNSLLRLFHLLDYSAPIKCHLNLKQLKQSIPNMPLHKWSTRNAKV